MFEQFLYYWSLWIIFIVVAFFMDKNKKKSFLMGWILLIMICSPFELSIYEIQLSIAFFVMMIGSIIFYTLESISFYKLFGTFTVMVCYMALRIWEKITPIWFFTSSYFIISVISVLLISLFFQTLYEQISVALVALGLGQIVYQLILISYHLHDTIGGDSFFIQISFIIILQMMVYFIQLVIKQLSAFFTQKFT